MKEFYNKVKGFFAAKAFRKTVKGIGFSSLDYLR